MFLASQIFKSNNALANSLYTDKGLFELKKAELKLSKDLIKYGREESRIRPLKLIEIIASKKLELLNYLFNWLNLKLTNGGTSLKKLLWILVIAIVLTSIFTGTLNVSYHDHILSYKGAIQEDLLIWLQNIPISVSLFLGFGYSSFKATNFSAYLLLSLIAITGLIWYALIIPVIIRKIYR